MSMGRPREEETRVKGVRLPVRIWKLLSEAAEGQGETSNNLIWRMVEGYLSKHGKIRDSDRKRAPIDPGKL